MFTLLPGYSTNILYMFTLGYLSIKIFYLFSIRKDSGTFILTKSPLEQNRKIYYLHIEITKIEVFFTK